MTALSLVRRLAGVGAVLALAFGAACSETLDGGSGCPSLCPITNPAVIDTTLDAIVLDTALAGVPVAGDVGTQLLAVRPGADSLDVRAVVRFDSVPGKFSPPAGGDSLPITGVDSTTLKLSLDTTGTRFTGPVTLEAYDVDTAAANDTAAAALLPLFRPDRLLGTLTLATQAQTGDTVAVPLRNAALVAKAQAGARLRIGLRLVATSSARLRFFGVGTTGATGASAPRVRYDPNSDTTYRPVFLYTNSVTPPPPALAAGYRVHTVVARAPVAGDGSDLVIGGLPARRTYFRFSVPQFFVDSVEVVRATLLLAQQPARGAGDPLDSTVLVRPLGVLATAAVTDLVRASGIASAAVGLDTVRLRPGGSGLQQFPIVNLVRAWRTLPAATPRALVLVSTGEGVQAGALRFYSTSAPAGLRPRLRLSYIPRTNFGLP